MSILTNSNRNSLVAATNPAGAELVVGKVMNALRTGTRVVIISLITNFLASIRHGENR